MLTLSSLTPELVELDRQFAAATEEASEVAEGLDDRQFTWRPGPDSWSIAECLLHLNMVNTRCVQQLEEVVAEARARGLVAQGPFGYGWLGRWILARTEPPSKHRYKAPVAFTPVSGQPQKVVLPVFRRLQEQLALQLEKANGLDLEQIKVRAPEARMLRFNLVLTFTWIAAHERRHLWQARQVRTGLFSSARSSA